MTRAVAVSAACAALLASGVANAGKETGSLGVGIDTTLSAQSNQASAAGERGALAGSGPLQQPGLSAVFQATDQVAVQLIFSLLRFSATIANVDQTTTAIQFALRGLYALSLANQIDLAAFGGLSLGRGSASVGDASDSGSDIVLEAGVRPEWFVTEHLSFHTQIGITISLLSEDNPLAAQGGTDIALFGNADLLGNAGFTFWF